ncbi:peptidase dimerization domain-containing protein, partial [Streptomyces sp. NK15101]|uniref:peptidase dimerization domain-containing protein n=1 Tax=Streptomyces sp. NK15101 TaxID=2873261 RepID=UPI001CEC200B
MSPIAVGGRGTAWTRLTAHGTAGHGSGPGQDNAVAELIHALSRLTAHRWPTRLTPAVRTLLDALDQTLGIRIDRDRLEEEANRLGGLGELFDCTVRNTLDPTVPTAGHKVDVIPSHAHAEVGGRFPPGEQDAFVETVDRLLGPKVTREFTNCEGAVAADHEGPAFSTMAEAIRSQDPHAHPVPFIQSGGTDAKAFAKIGISTHGFAPLLLDPHLHYPCSTEWTSGFPCPATTTSGTDGPKIGSVLLSDIAEEFGTPAFVLDEDDFRARRRSWRAAFTGHDV